MFHLFVRTLVKSIEVNMCYAGICVTDYRSNVSITSDTLHTVAISLNLSLAELTLYLWTMSKGLVTFSNGAAHTAAKKASLVRA